MADAYSGARRRLALADLAAGLSVRAVAARRDVSPATASRWAREAAAGITVARPEGGRGRRLLAGQRDWLRGEVEARPGVTLAALRTGLRARGAEVSLDTIWRMLREEGLGVGERKDKRKRPEEVTDMQRPVKGEVVASARGPS